MELGIDPDQGRIYEGRGKYGRLASPAPTIVPAKLVGESEEPRCGANLSEVLESPLRFREDSFDPISQVRRGRFYKASGIQPTQWFLWSELYPSSGLPAKGSETHSLELLTYYEHSIWNESVRGQTEPQLVLLGSDDRFTIWSIVDIETIVTGEELVTLKAHNQFGMLPRIRNGIDLRSGSAAMKEALSVLTRDFQRASPESVIDRAREAATQALLVYFELSSEHPEDLSKLAARLQEDKKFIAANSARTVALLHSRTKHAEQRIRSMRPVRQQDADFAMRCVGVILCELGFADWV